MAFCPTGYRRAACLQIKIKVGRGSILHVVRQPVEGVVDISTWAPDEDFPIYPVGSKPKRLVICPADEGAPFLKPGQGYLFKEARDWQSQQIWCEIIAYELSRFLGVDVPPAFAAIDTKAGQVGALIELFYPYPDTAKSTRLIHAADFMQGSFADGKRGRPHALRENLVLCRALKAGDSLSWWAQALIFDALIGNTDRHSENWGFLFQRQADGQSVTLAPLYDNGTSLGYGLRDNKLDPPWDAQRMAMHIQRGTHDCGWSREEDGPTPHLLLCERFFVTYPSMKSVAQKMLIFTDAEVEEVVHWAQRFGFPVGFSSARGSFIVHQLAARRDALVGAIGL